MPHLSMINKQKVFLLTVSVWGLLALLGVSFCFLWMHRSTVGDCNDLPEELCKSKSQCQWSHIEPETCINEPVRFIVGIFALFGAVVLGVFFHWLALDFPRWIIISVDILSLLATITWLNAMYFVLESKTALVFAILLSLALGGTLCGLINVFIFTWRQKNALPEYSELESK